MFVLKILTIVGKLSLELHLNSNLTSTDKNNEANQLSAIIVTSIIVIELMKIKQTLRASHSFGKYCDKDDIHVDPSQVYIEDKDLPTRKTDKIDLF